jgi:hypothetical protein
MDNHSASAAPAGDDPPRACVYDLRPLSESEVYTLEDAHRYYAQRCGPGLGTVAGVLLHAIGLLRLTPLLERLQCERRSAYRSLWVLPAGSDHYLLSFGIDGEEPGHEAVRFLAEIAKTPIETRFAAALLAVTLQLAAKRRDWVARGRPFYRITYDCGPDAEYLAALTRSEQPFDAVFGPN